MPSNGRGWVHRGYDHDSLKRHVIEVHVIEALVAYDLLKEGNQLDGVVLVWAGQIDVFQIDDKPLALLRSEYTSL